MLSDCSMREVRMLAKSADGFSKALWTKMAELGWLGLVIPERFGGLGLKWVDLVVLLEETGRGLSPLPLVSHALAATAILRCGSDRQKEAWLPKLATGELVGTLGLYDDPTWISPEAITLDGLNGAKRFVPDAQAANLLVLAHRTGSGLALALIERNAKGVSIASEPIVDATKRTATVKIESPSAETMPLSNNALEFLTDCGAVAVTAEMVGAADAALALTTDYAKTRIQFGAPIGKYQGVKHRLAEMYVDVESFKSLLYYAAWTVDDAPAELPRAASLAKAYASDAFARIGIDAVGLHGAIGFTAEYDAQLFLKRSKWARPAFGDSDHHYERVAALGGV
jgi:alkylation response protein AidB-like acyl-CoA dehydrogenase